MQPMSACIITPIDVNKYRKSFNDNDIYYRPYEKEAILSYTYFRQRGKWKGPIYALNLSGAKISERTKRKCRELSVTYIEEYHSITETFGLIGDLNKPLCAVFAEENFKEDILIYSDLSILSVSPIHDLLSENYILVSRVEKYGEIFNNMSSCFLSFPKKFGFARTWLDKSLEYHYRNKNRDVIDDTLLPLRFIEEYAASKLLANGVYPTRIEPFIFDMKEKSTKEILDISILLPEKGYRLVNAHIVYENTRVTMQRLQKLRAIM